jgi:hypothetical protein
MNAKYDFTDPVTFEKWDSEKERAYKIWLQEIKPGMESIEILLQQKIEEGYQEK